MACMVCNRCRCKDGCDNAAQADGTDVPNLSQLNAAGMRLSRERAPFRET